MLMTWSDYAVELRGWTSCDIKYREGKSQRMETTLAKSPRSRFGPRGFRISLTWRVDEFPPYSTPRLCKGRNGSGGGRRVGRKAVNVREMKAKSPQIVSDTLYSNF